MSKILNIAYLSMTDLDEFHVYDSLTVEPMAKRGFAVADVPWTEPTDWSEYAAVVIRSTWDYQQAAESFLNTLATISAQTRLFNPLEVCRWNLNKRYLRTLEERGCRIVPTRWPDRLSPEMVRQAFDGFDSDRLVAKPLVGANADNAFVLSADAPSSWSGALAFYRDRPAMLQPFLPSIVAFGERSLFYFGGEYSHAILKTPARGDFRVQEEHGGVIQAITADADARALAERTLDAIGETLLYARVDLATLADGSPALMEVELVEPSLYFDQDADSPVRFAEAFDRMMG